MQKIPVDVPKLNLFKNICKPIKNLKLNRDDISNDNRVMMS